MVSLRDQFMSKSEEKRIKAQVARRVAQSAPVVAKVATCPHFTTPFDTPFRSDAPACGKPVIAYGPHGHLCKEHRIQQDAIVASMSKQRRTMARHEVLDFDYAALMEKRDLELSLSIVASERALINAGKVERVRYGSAAPGYEPTYFNFWTQV